MNALIMTIFLNFINCASVKGAAETPCGYGTAEYVLIIGIFLKCEFNVFVIYSMLRFLICVYYNICVAIDQYKCFLLNCMFQEWMVLVEFTFAMQLKHVLVFDPFLTKVLLQPLQEVTIRR